MKVFYKKDNHVVIWFGVNELKAALATLKGIAKHFNLDFVWTASQELERDLNTPRLPPPSPYHHICEHCITEIDTRKQEYIQREGRYVHQRCPTLKDNRPI